MVVVAASGSSNGCSPIALTHSLHLEICPPHMESSGFNQTDAHRV